jgi:hypothetical protein
MLTAIEQLATEQYALIKAQQDVQLAYAGVQLQTLRVQEALDGVVLGNPQQRAKSSRRIIRPHQSRGTGRTK